MSTAPDQIRLFMDIMLILEKHLINQSDLRNKFAVYVNFINNSVIHLSCMIGDRRVS